MIILIAGQKDRARLDDNIGLFLVALGLFLSKGKFTFSTLSFKITFPIFYVKGDIS